jgi:hypothetical protein
MSNRERMRDMEFEQDSSDWIMPGALLAVGLPFMLIAMYMAGEEVLFRRTAQRIPGVVTEISSGTPTLAVEYALPGGANQRIESFGSDLYEDVKVGDVVGVYVKPAHPEKGRLDYFTDAWMLPLIMGVFGSFFGIPGLLVARSQLRTYLRRRERLKLRDSFAGAEPEQRQIKNARQVKADVLEIRPVITMAGLSNRDPSAEDIECRLAKEGDQWRLMVNGEQQDPFDPHANRSWGVSYSVVAQWLDAETGKTHVCESEPVDTDPSFYLQFGTVTVLVDPKDPDNSVVDMGFLPGQQ